ncbi:MAG: alpha/beta hydrolase [Chloroflexi bacterium]|nr:alpha/beta hydrolase [Chloroflexota bacterium]
MSIRRRFLLIALGIILIPVIYLGARTGYRFYRWANFARQPVAEALPALESSDLVSVEDDRWVVFTPANSTPRTGLIFYPGARIDPRAYAPLAQDIAEQGYLVVLLPVRFALANWQPNAAEPVIAAFPNIETWAVGGHSLGGVVAAEFTNTHIQDVDGLVLWAAYPAEDQNLSSQSIDVISIHASQDGLVTVQEVADNKYLLPASTEYVLIEGGNHAQYAWYGNQRNDFTPTIDADSQQAAIVEATLSFLQELEAGTAASE